MENRGRIQQFKTGLAASVPIVLGYIPVAIAYAIMARQAGFSLTETCLLSVFVFAGAAQMMAVGMVAQGASVLSVVVTTFILNFRHLIMSTCVYNRISKCGTGIKMLTAFGVTDETFAVFTTGKDADSSAWYLLGLVTGAYSSWNVGTIAGAIASDFLPEMLTLSLGISLYAMFIAILVPSLSRNVRLGLLAVLTALVNFALTRFVASSHALILSTLICAFIGTFFVDMDEETEESSK